MTLDVFSFVAVVVVAFLFFSFIFTAVMRHFLP